MKMIGGAFFRKYGKIKAISTSRIKIVTEM